MRFVAHLRGRHLKLFEKKPSQQDVDDFRAIAKDIQNGTVQDPKKLVVFSRLGWVTTLSCGGKETWVLTGAGLYVHAYGHVKPENNKP